MHLNKIIIKTGVFIALSLITMGAFAASGLPDEPMPTAPEFSHWQFRLRGIGILPDESSSRITYIGGHVTDISKQVVPELDVNYYFMPNISLELIAATANHSVKATNTALGSVNLGSVSLLPPTLTALYHFMPHATVSPYLGAGVNYTYFYDISHGPVATKISYSNTWGPAAQAGFDVNINEHWSLNADVKKIWIEPDVKVMALGLPLKTKVKINPWVVGIGVGYRI